MIGKYQYGSALTDISTSSAQVHLTNPSEVRAVNAPSNNSQISISTPSYLIGMNSKEIKLISYSFTGLGNNSGELTSFTYRFYTQYDEPLSSQVGPYLTKITVNPFQKSDWAELIYLPEKVVENARAIDDYAIVLKTSFEGNSYSGEELNAETSVLLLLPPDTFSKVSPADGTISTSTDQLLHWESSIGAIDY